ncbi:Kazal-type serine protease inhibitor domain-containing protein [Neolewinella lacunae]|uniref:T9SS type A sorting domain-containing protein n=1 Tax=Neolewinella lacunae TaxID=1517758 RepID=A0A923PKX1_9BACT|nr:Kazal-type serine protease inhibitor domain-containing protein [Neolewinella lacunae]MBC6995972.1 T9SS type A sorting domain-containing protein [Neolewinella lacunae]MDN3635184.1 Kazal-type serine protease inhibitor domain-containing protein [Neolewinella lacunae]
MHYTFTLLALFTLAFLPAHPLTAQETLVWPGDANHNGVVNGVDFLYLGHAFNTKGEERPHASTAWYGQAMGTPWENSFPGGVNFAHADADGDARVAARDFNILLRNQYRTRNGAIGDDPYVRPDTTENYEALLRLLPAGVQLTAEGSFLLLDVSLTGRNAAFPSFHGISFRATLPGGSFASTRLSEKILTERLQTGTNSLLHWMTVDSARNELNFSATHLGGENRSANGSIARLALPLATGVSAEDLLNGSVVIDSIVLFNANMGTHRVATSSMPLVSDAGCSFTVSPVCGANGITYLNSCFADAAGVTFYTPGACWNPGLDVAAMNPSATCPTAYAPVCGFNGVTYPNACTAEAAGVVNYTTGLCSPGDLSCYDPSLVVISNGTSANLATGVITLNCPSGNTPVCGCDGEQYASACAAEAAGVRSYTTGACSAACVDPTEITSPDNCGSAINFVCGCNGETYINPCFAAAAGVQSTTPGPCNGVSGWCAEATVISCGDYLPNETTVGAGNQLTSYPGATGVLMQGPDRVYTFQKTSAGDIQIGLEIMTPGLNMDIFLLRGDCNNYQVVGYSTTSNTQTNNEGIVLEDAPNGTYYIVVDAPFAGPGGNYRLELSCGYLDCSDRVPLTCGVTYNGTNAGGNDDVSAYSCGPTLNVENNGPEIVHTFTVTEPGLVTIDLTGLSADLELFLLSECDRGSCLQFSQNPGLSPEQIVRYLPAGTYVVVVDGYNGAVSNYSLRVDCTASCDLSYQVLSQTNTGCGQASGSITVQVTGGSPTYTAHYVGPVCRTAISYTGTFTFSDLPPGTYTTVIEDSNGCEITFNFTITSGNGGLTGTLTPTDAGCGQEGSIGVSLNGGVAPYVVYVSGASNAVLTTANRNFTIRPLNPGVYQITIVDLLGCSLNRTVTVGQSSGGLDVDVWGEPAGCDDNLGEIVVRASSGTLPFHVTVRGPVNGGATVNGYNFRVRSLPAGQYTFTLTDAFGCVFEQIVTIASGNLQAQVSATAANCASPGAARVTISAGTPPYTINYTGPVAGTVNTSQAITVINGLSSGSYNFSIWDGAGCDQVITVFVGDNGGSLNLLVEQLTAACDGNNSSLRLSVSGGIPNYTVTYTGAATGSLTIGGNGTANLSLPAGTYTFRATDFSGCTATYNLTVSGGLSNAGQQSFSFGLGCGQQDNIRTIFNGGEGPYGITVTSPCSERDTAFTLNGNTFELYDLPNCTYTITATDAGGCLSVRTVTIDVDPNAGILILTPLDGACGGLGAIDLVVSAGEFPYFITWTGPVSGSINLASQMHRVRNLPAGTYTFQLTNADGCEDTQSVTLLNDGSLEVISSVVTDDCGVPYQIWNDIEGGQAPYTVEVIRLCDSTQATITIDTAGFEIEDIIPCDYKIKVTDANGCMTMQVVTIFPYQLFNALVTDGICGQPGQIVIQVMNEAAQGPYTVSYTGPQIGTFTTPSGTATIADLPAGTYTVTVTDRNGCTETEVVVVEDIPSDLELQTALINDDCGQYNQLWNDISGGEGPYTITVIRLCDGVTDTTFTQNGLEFELMDLEECTYKIIVVDANDCMVMTTTEVEGGEPELFTVTPISGPCGQPGRIDLSFTRGTPPFQVTYTGPQSGNNTVNGNALSINNAPAGTYTFTVTDANGCTEMESVTLVATTNDLVLEAALIYNECGQYNQIWVDIFNGTGPFSVEVIRLCDGTTMTEFVTGDVGFELFDLPPCDYKIIVTDAAGCMVMDVITVFPAPIDLFDLESSSGDCNEPGSFNVHITRGRAPFQITWSGPTNGSITTSDTLFTQGGLLSGNYTVFVTDSLGCIETGQFTINNTTSDLDLETALIFNECNQLNQLWNDINGGVPPFTVEVTRLCTNTTDTVFTTTEREFELNNRTPCEYKIKVTDALGCMDMETVRITSSSANLYNVRVDNSCDSSGFHLDFIAGTGPFRVVISGPLTAQFLDVTESLYIAAPPGDYMLRAFSAEGCTETTFSAVTGGGSGAIPTVAFTSQGNSLVRSFTNASSPGTYAWTFGDGGTSTLRDPEHTYAGAGTYNVCLTVTNACGPNTACQTVQVANASNVQVVIGGASSFAGNSVRIPVSLQGVSNLATIAGTFALDQPGLATITHVSAGAILPQFNPQNRTFSFVSNGTAGVSLNGNIEVLFFIHLNLGNTVGSTDIQLVNSPVSLEISSVQNGVPTLLPANYLPGFVTVAENLLGHISTQAYDMDDEAIDNVDYELSEEGGNYTLTLPQDANGLASTLAGLNLGQMYYLQPVRAGDPRNGLSSFEVFLAQRYLLGHPVPQITSPLQVVAADMNCSQSFTNLDLYLMQRILIGDLDEIPGCGPWTFVPDHHTFPADWNRDNVFPAPRRAEIMLSSDTLVMFTGMKTGDLLSDADLARSVGDLPLELSWPAAPTAGETYLLRLRLPENTALVSFQGLLRAAAGIEIVSVASADLPDLQVGTRLLERGEARLSWYSNTGASWALNAGAGIVEVAVRVGTDYTPGELPLSFTTTPGFGSAAYDADWRRLTPSIQLATETLPRFLLLPAAPNPAVEYADIRFVLPATERVSLTVFDALGRPVIQRQQVLPAGNQSFRLDLRTLPAGVYHYRVGAGAESGAGRLVKE